MVRRAEQACVENSENDGFRSIIPASSFMTPLESRNEESMSRVRMFGPDKLSVDLSKQKWDQFKVESCSSKCFNFQQLLPRYDINVEIMNINRCNYHLGCMYSAF